MVMLFGTSPKPIQWSAQAMLLPGTLLPLIFNAWISLISVLRLQVKLPKPWGIRDRGNEYGEDRNSRMLVAELHVKITCVDGNCHLLVVHRAECKNISVYSSRGILRYLNVD